MNRSEALFPDPPPGCGPYILTSTGNCFDFQTYKTIDLEDIVRHLSFMCRWTGAVRHFYSVAEHSLWVEEHLKLEGATLRERLLGLLHDSAEAYIGDISSPLKCQLSIILPGSPPCHMSIVRWEEEFQEELCDVLGIDCWTREEHNMVSAVDMEALENEWLHRRVMDSGGARGFDEVCAEFREKLHDLLFLVRAEKLGAKME
jgi:hypothetical protein